MRPRRIALLFAVFLFTVGLASCGKLFPFLSTFEVENKSGQTVWVTPIGMTEGGGNIRPLPRYEIQGDRPKRHPQATRILIEPGETVVITYDFDDINFRHILVRSASDHVHLLDTDKRGTLHVCWGAREETYAIPTLEAILTAPDELLPCEEGRPVSYEPLRIEYPNRDE